MSKNSPTSSPEQRQATQPIQVLHVDDEPGFAELASEFLSREDERFSIHTETGPDDALDFLCNNSVDCIVSDYDMPGRNGLDLLRAVRDEYNNIPFILFTGKGSEEIASEAISTGVDEYLQKGRGSDQYTVLANRIKNVTSKRRAEHALENRIRQQEVVAEFGQNALSSDDLQELSENAVRHVADTLGNEYAKVLDWRPEYDDLRLVAGVGWRDGLVGDATVGDGLDSQAGYTLRSEEPIIVDDLQSEERFSGPPLLVEHEVVSGISVIIGDFDDPWGVFGTHTTNRKAFTQDDVTFVQSIANVLANAIERTEREQRFQAVFDKAFDAIVIADDDGRYTNVNAAACELFGLPKEELLGRTIEQFAPDDYDIEEAWTQFQAAEKERSTFPLVRSDGTTRMTEYGATSNIVPGEHLSILRDITEREQQQQALKTSEARYRSLTDDVLDTSQVGTIILDANFEIVWINEAVAEYFGLDRETSIGADKRELITAHVRDIVADSERVAERVLATYSDNTYIEQFECHIEPDSDREERWLEHWSQPIESGLYEGGRIEHYTDITERKELEEELTEAADQYQTLVEQNVAGIYILREDGLEYVNPRFCETFGYSEEEILSIDISELIAPEFHDLVEENVRKRLAGELDETEYTATVIRGDGKPIHVRVHGTRIEYEGEPAILGTLVDITEQTELKEQLERERTFLSQLLDTSPVGIVVLDADGNIERANQQAEEVLRLSKDEITSRTYNDPAWTILDETGEKLRDEELPFKRVIDTGEPVFDARHEIRWPDGSHRLLSVNAAPAHTQSGEIERVIAVVRDITEQREYEQTIEQQNKQLEEFASAVSHDIRNPLNAAHGWVKLAQEECDSEHLVVASDSLERSQALIDDLLTLAREGERVRDIEAVHLADTVESAWRNVKTDEATLVTNTEWTVRADRSQLQRLLENLLRNAVEHGGTDVTVTIGDLENGFYVADDGAGIPPDVREQVFKPGYSTATEGTGFGLNIVEEIAGAHSWDVKLAESEVGGARFELTSSSA